MLSSTLVSSVSSSSLSLAISSFFWVLGALVSVVAASGAFSSGFAAASVDGALPSSLGASSVFGASAAPAVASVLSSFGADACASPAGAGSGAFASLSSVAFGASELGVSLVESALSVFVEVSFGALSAATSSLLVSLGTEFLFLFSFSSSDSSSLVSGTSAFFSESAEAASSS